MSTLAILTKCPLAKCPLAKCPLAKCRLAKCPLAKCHGFDLSISWISSVVIFKAHSQYPIYNGKVHPNNPQLGHNIFYNTTCMNGVLNSAFGPSPQWQRASHTLSD